MIEGQIDDVFGLIKRAQQVGIDEGATEVLTNIKIHYNKNGVSIEEKLTHIHP